MKSLGPRGLEPREELMGNKFFFSLAAKDKKNSLGLEEYLMMNLLEMALLSSELYPRPHALGPRPPK
jgi:hypothetical protein